MNVIDFKCIYMVVNILPRTSSTTNFVRNVICCLNQETGWEISNRSKMRSKTSQQLANEVCHYYEKVVARSKTLAYSHFKSLGIHPVTICRILQRYEATGTANYQKLTGRPVRVMTSEVITSVDKLYKKNSGVSGRNLAEKLKLPKTIIHIIKAQKLNIKSLKAINAPKYTEQQKKRAKTISAKLQKNA